MSIYQYFSLCILSFLFSACGGGSGTVPQSSWYKPAVVTTWQWQLTGNVNTLMLSISMISISLTVTAHL